MTAPVPDGIYRVGLDALVRRYGPDFASPEQVMIVVDAVLPRIAAAERQRIESVLATDGKTVLATAGGALLAAVPWSRVLEVVAAPRSETVR